MENTIVEDGIRLASPCDISAMKLNAIEGRGSKKDFVDIFYLLRHFTLAELLDAYQKKYPNHSVFRALMSLTYFEDAEQQPLPKMFDAVSWEQMKGTISAAVKNFR